MTILVTTVTVNELKLYWLMSTFLAAFKTTSIKSVKKLYTRILQLLHVVKLEGAYCDFSLASSSGLRQCVNIGTMSSNNSPITTGPASPSKQLNIIQSAECELQLV